MAVIIRLFQAIISEARIQLATNMEITRGGALPPPPQTPLPLPEAAPGQPLARPLSGVLEALILAIDPPARVAQGNSANYSIEIALSGERLQVTSSSYFTPGSRLLLRALSDSRLHVDGVLPAASPVLLKAALRNALPAQLPVRDALLAIRELGSDAALPGPIRQRIAELLMRLPSPAQAQSPRSLRELIMNSGLLLEGRLRASAAAALQGTTSANQAAVNTVPAGVHSNGQLLLPGSALPSNQSTAAMDKLETAPGATLNPAQHNAASSLAGGRAAEGIYAILRLLQRFSGPPTLPTAPLPPQSPNASGSHLHAATYDARGQLGTAATPANPGAWRAGTVAPGMDSALAAQGLLSPASTNSGPGAPAGSGAALRGAASAAPPSNARTDSNAPMQGTTSGTITSNRAHARLAEPGTAVQAGVSTRKDVGVAPGSAGAAGATPSGSPNPAGDPRNSLPIDPVSPRMLSHDFKAQLLGLLELLRNWPSAVRTQAQLPGHFSATTQSGLPAPLLYTARGQLNPGMLAAHTGSASPKGPATGQRGGPPSEASPDVQHLLIKYVEAALARTRIHQIAGLPESRQANDSAPLASWTVEIPLQRGHQLDLLEMRVDDHGEHPSPEGQPLRLWRLMMTLEIETLGPMHAWLQLAGKRLSATLWAERSATLDAARSSLRLLIDALETQGVEVTQLECKAGRPPDSQVPLFERLLDVQT